MASERVRIFEGHDGQLYFQRVDGNNKVVATSEGYTEPGGALKGAANAFKDMESFILEREGGDVIVARADAEEGRIGAAE